MTARSTWYCVAPLPPVTFATAWLTETAVGIDSGIYDDRAYEHLPILADALKDAGCEDVEVLAHCRGDGPHVRGCWVVDGVLGKCKDRATAHGFTTLKSVNRTQ